MKKIFTLFAVALIGFCAYAQDNDPCPSKVYFTLAEEEQDASNVMVYLHLTNSTEYLNGFNMEVQKPDAAQWIEDEEDGEYVGFSGYGHVILANWNPTNPNWVETKLFQKADLKCSVKDVTHDDGTVHQHLVIIELLSTTDCYYFPVLGEGDDDIVARFSVDFSGCEDTREVLTLRSDNTPSGCAFSITGDPVHGTRSWTMDEPAVLELEKVDGKVRKATSTAISTITTDQAVDNRIFDLQGRELQSVPEHGIYIQNGKKYVK